MRVQSLFHSAGYDHIGGARRDISLGRRQLAEWHKQAAIRREAERIRKRKAEHDEILAWAYERGAKLKMSTTKTNTNKGAK